MQKMDLDLIKRFDPLAISPLVKDRSQIYYFAKRAMDLILATILLLLFSPIMVLIGLLIRIDSQGPVIFTQKRVGVKRSRNNGFTYWRRVDFTCYKFRTMVQKADPSLHQAYVTALIKNDQDCMKEVQGKDTNTYKLVDDPRVTPLGRFLRKSSLDELPQFWNVIIGDMSLVGPRPAIPYEIECYEPWHLQRLQGKPGLTGLWQVTARCSADFDEAVRLDIEYLQTESLWLDFKILIKTPFVVLSFRGAY
jgi:lipopolysaccharide/colanic/teichoic acid biosynthesis glycosyltransferase